MLREAADGAARLVERRVHVGEVLARKQRGAGEILVRLGAAVALGEELAHHVELHQRAATQSDRERVRHAKVGAYAADFDGDVRLARETLLQHADVRGGTADVDHHRVVQVSQEAGTAQ